MLIEQHSSSQVGDADRSSRRLLILDESEVSRVRQIAAWLALAVTVAVAVLLLVGGG